MCCTQAVVGFAEFSWEIGHLAAVPRNPITVENTAANVAQTRRIVGMTPMVENIATLIAPPASSLTEAEWLSRIAAAAAAPRLAVRSFGASAS
jgi:uncharacterized protein (UPF0276 family)